MSGPGGIDWNNLVGHPVDLKYARRDLPILERAANLAREHAACVQAGANAGVFPLFLAQCFSEVYCFEPHLDTYEEMLENVPIALNKVIIARHAALGEEAGTATLHMHRRGLPGFGHPGTYHVTIEDHPTSGYPVDVVTIDGLGLEKCGLIYLDIEGFELAALKGARATIARCRPVIGVEINKNLASMETSARDLIEFILGLFYIPAFEAGSDKVFVPTEWRREARE